VKILPDNAITQTTRDEHETEWLDEKREHSAVVAQQFVAMADKIRALPAPKEEATKLVVADNIRSLVAVANDLDSGEFTQRQFQAAMLLGWGLTKMEVADALDIPGGEGTLHEWHRCSKPFQQLVNYWRQEAEHDHFAKAVREIELLAAETTDPNLRLKLLKFRLDLADKPEDRYRWSTEVTLREREVAAHEKEASRGTESAPSFPIPNDDVIDAEFTVRDDSGL